MADAFSDVFANVQDFGLGVGADDTLGLQSLIGTGRPLLFPTGVYRLASVLNFNQANQTSLFAAGAILQLEGLGYVKITGVNQTFRGLRIEVTGEDSGSSAAQSESAPGTKTSSPTKSQNGRVTPTSGPATAGSPEVSVTNAGGAEVAPSLSGQLGGTTSPGATGDPQSVSPGSATATNKTLASVSLTSATLSPL